MNANNFYSSTASGWLKVRKIAILKSNGLCCKCKKTFTDTSKLIVHHINHLSGNDYNNPEKALNEANLEVMCLACHNIEHDKFKLKKSVVIVYGPPLAGKSTFVRENKAPDDLVIDLDAIASAISFNPLYDKVDALKNNMFAVKNLLIDNIKTKYGYWRTAWIIGGYPNSFERERLAKELNAECVLVEATEQECVNRLYNIKDYRRNKLDEWEKYIKDWFQTYTPIQKN